MSKKYELTTETKEINGRKVYRIKALKSFATIIGRMVDKGDLGGWVESEANLAHAGKCWLFDNAAGYENSRRTGNSVGYENSQQYGNSRQFGYSRQYGNSWQFGSSRQSGDSSQYDNSRQFGNSRQYGNSSQYGDSMQSGDSRQYGNSRQYGHSQQFGYSMQSGNSQQYGDSSQFGNSQQYGDSSQYGNSSQYGDSRQSGNSWQYGDSRQSGNSWHCTGADDGTGCILCIGPCGDSQRTVTVQPDNTIVAGCFHGSFKEFKCAVVEKYGKDYGTYSMCIKILNMSLQACTKRSEGD